MEHLKQTNETKKSMSSCVKFSKDEYERITAEASIFGESIPWVLKNSHFNKKPVVPMFAFDDARKIISALARIGNNVNQIARKINSGFREGSNDYLCNISEDIHVLRTFAEGTYGSHQNKIYHSS